MLNDFLLSICISIVSKFPNIIRCNDKIIFNCVPLKILNINPCYIGTKSISFIRYSNYVFRNILLTNVFAYNCRV